MGKNKGITLVEVLIGICIFSVGFLAFTKVQQKSALEMVKVCRKTKAIMLARSYLEEIMQNLTTGGLKNNNIVINNNGVIYNLSFVISPGPYKNTKHINLSVKWAKKEISFETLTFCN